MELKANIRTELGKAARSLRDRGLVPAELYGPGTENIHLSASLKDLRLVLKEAGQNQIIVLNIENNNPRKVLVHELQKDPITDGILNVDFYAVKADKKIHARIPLEFIGESPALTNLGGILVKSAQELEVEALPFDIPPKITVDISPLKELGQSVYVKNLKIDESKIKILSHRDTALATAQEPRVEEEVQEAEAAPAPAAAPATGTAETATGKTAETKESKPEKNKSK